MTGDDGCHDNYGDGCPNFEGTFFSLSFQVISLFICPGAF